MQKVRGRIIVVQEERFRLVDDEGRSFLFNLAHNANATNQDLLDWSRAKLDLSVEYEGEPEIDTGTARSIRTA